MPDPGMKCTFKPQNFLVTVLLNVMSVETPAFRMVELANTNYRTDAAILCIPLPLLWTLQVPLKK